MHWCVVLRHIGVMSHGYKFRMVLLAVVPVLLQGCVSRVDRNVARVVMRHAADASLPSTNVALDAMLAVPERMAPATALELDLGQTLRLATRYSRSLQAQREELYLNGLSLLGEERNFELQLSGTVNYVLGVSGEGDDSSSVELRASRSLPTGARLELTGQSSRWEERSGTNDAGQSFYQSPIELRLTQPLLAGAGYVASHEALTQARRDLVYALRSFALQRQDFAIEIVREYYNLLTRKTVLANTRLNVEQSIFLRKRSEALFEVRMATALDVMRAQQQALSSRNQLEVTQAEYDVALKRFLITLGVPVDINVSVVGVYPGVSPIDLLEKDCIDTALVNRMDLLTTRERLEDSRRRLSVARNGLLPRLDAFAEAALADQRSESFSDQDPDERITAGVMLEIPFDKRDERDAVRRAEIAVVAARRQLGEVRDTVRVEIMENFRRLETLRITVDIQRKNMDIAGKRARNALLRFKNGELSNRDVVEAENDLLDARNAYARALVDHEVQRLRLLRNVGLLDIGPDGTLVVLSLDEVRDAAEKVER